MNSNHHGDILHRAGKQGDSEAFLAEDFAYALFPKSGVSFNDRMLSNARQYLSALIRDIEKQICLIAIKDLGVGHEGLAAVGNAEAGLTYPLLERSGLLANSVILNHILAQSQYNELGIRLLQNISQEELEATLTRHLDHENPAIADAAMALLVAQGRSTGSDGQKAVVEDVPSEMLFALTWPVSAALAKLSDFDGPELGQATERFLATHDEGAGVLRRAERLAMMLAKSDDQSRQSIHPMRDGLALFVARMAQLSGLNADQIVRFTAEPVWRALLP